MSSEEKAPVAVSEEVLTVLGERLSELIGALKMNVSLGEGEVHGGTAYFNLTGDDTDYFLANKAEPLKNMAYLMQTWHDHVYGETGLNVKVDADGELRRKEEALTKMAMEACEQLKEVGQETKLEPLNPYDRRVVHIVLRQRPEFDSESVGHGHFKSMVIRRVSES